MSGDLTKYNAAKKALAEAVRIDEVKDIRDKATAMRIYTMQAKDRVLIDRATEIRLRAERRAGELLRDMEKNKGTRGEGRPKLGGRDDRPPKDPTPTLADLNIKKSQSSQWQKLADLPKDDFEAIVTKAQHKATDAVDRAQQPKPKPKPKSKPEAKRKPAGNGDGSDVIAACVAEVRASVRAAVAKLEISKISFLVDDLRKVITGAVAEATTRDVEADRWTETTH